MITGAAELGKRLRVWIENGGSSGDAAIIANALDSATTMTDMLIFMRPIKMQLVHESNNVWRIVDSRQNEVLAFRFFEKPVGGADVLIV